jgi:hypothetical protein
VIIPASCSWRSSPAAKSYQQAMFEQGQPAAMFFTGDLQTD